MAAHEQQNSTPTPGEAVYTAYLEKSKRTSASILGWDPQSLREDLRKLGWTGGDVEDAVTYWSSLPRAPPQGTPSGWRRDLTMECVEPNPGPTLAEILAGLRTKLAADADAFEDDIKQFEAKIREAYPNIRTPSDIQVGQFLQEHENVVNTIFKDDATNVKKFIQELLPKGWQRELLRECVEPNPGPSWEEIKKDLVDKKLGGPEKARQYSVQLNDLENLVGEVCGLPNEKKIREKFLLSEKCTEFMKRGDIEETIIGFLAEIVALPAGQSLLDGLPELGPRKASQSKPSISKQHEGVDHTVKLFRLTNKTLLRTPSIIWQLALRGNFFWAAEATLVTYVSLVLSDCFQMLGLQDLSVLQEVTLHSLRPDLIIVFNGIHPIGVVEIKTPHPGVLDDCNVHGQIYDYMKRIQQYFGVQHIFGIVTTYTQWRVFWLPTTDDTASSEDSAVNSSATSMHSEEEDPHETFEDKDIDVDLEPVQSSLRHVSCTAIYEWNDPQLPRVLCTTIWKMRCSPVAPVTLGDPMRELCCMTATHTVWVKSPFAKPNFKLNYRNAPTASAEKFILLKDLGFGAEGRVWMVCSTTGQVGALKFRHAAINGETLEESLQKLKDEADNWDLLYKKGRIVQAGGFDGLLMPYARPSSIASTSYSTSDAQAAVKEAVVHIAKNGYIHNDMNIRHTGVISPAKKGGKPTGLVTDLSSLVKHDGDEEKALTTMLAALGMK